MSVEEPPSSVERPAALSNRRQLLLFAALTVVLTLATVWGGRIWFRHSETLVFATGEANGVEARFAAKLATVLKNNSSKLRLKIVANADDAKAVAQFDRRQADLVVLRTDARLPARARAIAILEHDVLLLITPKGKKIKSLAALKKTKVAVVGGSENEAFLRRTLEPVDDASALRIQTVPADSALDKLFASGYGAVAVVAHASKMIKDKSYEKYARQAGGFTLNAIDEAKAIARRIPGISSETLETGMLSSAPAIPDDDLETIALQWLLVAQSRMSTGSAGELARIIYENKSELALDDGFAAKIEPADTDKNALIIAHPGAAEYINDDTKSFMDRYSDMMYLGAAALSIIGSIFAGIYTKITRVAPEKASELATAILGVGERIEHAHTMDEIDALQDELEAILRGAVVGLRDGTISSDGLDTFRLGYEFVRDEIGMRRDHLKRHASHDDNVVSVKTVHSA
ncbi:TAXI family TRAP transporter solute-binding subunit [Bradyrhizobium sp.]|jgi:TRAP-type uncharacterized transport system substrate-binding protein|uniref:TAXI family TRAP transporter solute-binding subunit n=1 Tax=Bradyrhizobium sp. TaxID=376 RepID=UPI002DFF61C8|nr:TAXI family TRAP transporter solute-binding subunit [Bradyrhizobium sp.]